MTDIPIPAASLQRITQMYQALDQTAQIIAEAMGIPANQPRGLNIERGCFVVEDEPQVTQNGVTDHLTDGTLAR